MRNRKTYYFFFVILNYMNYSLTAHLVDNIKKSIVGYDEYGILIVDNASPNESYEILKKQFDGVKDVFVIKNNMNQGYAKGNNFGVKYIEKNFSECKYVAITNPDVEFFDNTDLGKILKKLESNTMIASIAPIHLLNGAFNQKAIGWKRPKGFDDIFTSFALTNFFFSRIYYKSFKIEPDRVSYVEVLSGSFFIIKLDVFKKVGYFDEHTFLYAEEAILSNKLMALGYKQIVDFESFFIHNHSAKVNRKLVARIKESYYSLNSKAYYNANYNKPIGKLVAALLYILYPVRILEILGIVIVSFLNGIRNT